jgi:hypothetical protein
MAVMKRTYDGYQHHCRGSNAVIGLVDDLVVHGTLCLTSIAAPWIGRRAIACLGVDVELINARYVVRAPTCVRCIAELVGL